jgi:hypothetical protein
MVPFMENYFDELLHRDFWWRLLTFMELNFDGIRDITFY